MRGRRFYKGGRFHPDRDFYEMTGLVEEAAEAVGADLDRFFGNRIERVCLRTKLRLTLKVSIKPEYFSRLLKAIIYARMDVERHGHTATRKDAIAELEGMQGVPDDDLVSILARCSPRTLNAIQAAHHGIYTEVFVNEEGWEITKPMDVSFPVKPLLHAEKSVIGHYHFPAGIEGVRNAINEALVLAQNTPDKRGPGDSHRYILIALGRACRRFVRKHTQEDNLSKGVKDALEGKYTDFEIAGVEQATDELLDALSGNQMPKAWAGNISNRSEEDLSSALVKVTKTVFEYAGFQRGERQVSDILNGRLSPSRRKKTARAK